jgi:hypothetical protein
MGEQCGEEIGGVCLGLARTIFIRCTYGIFDREITKYMVIYGVYIRFWPILSVR